MKKIGQYTVRGQSISNTTRRIILFDGRFDTGYVVKKIYLYPNSGIGAGNDCHGVLYTESGAVSSGLDWDFGENEQIGWAAGIFSGASAFGSDGNGLVDPDNLVIEDLFLKANHSGSGTSGYLIVMEKYEFTDWKGALAMVRNRSQS